MNKKEIWDLVGQVANRFDKCTESATNTAAMFAGFDPGLFAFIASAYSSDPDPVSIARFRIRAPYSSPARVEERLSSVSKSGFLDEAPEGGYVLSQRGREAFNKIVNAERKQLETLAPLPPAEMNELKLLLARIVQAALLSPEHLSKWCLLHNRRFAPDRSSAPIIAIGRYLSDLFAYRDDAHLASWLSHAISAHAWDILGALWQGKASSEAGVIELMKPRQWTENQTREAIRELIEKGWIKDGRELILTKKGLRIREAAEQLTDQIFFSLWDVLADAECGRLSELLTQMNKSLARSGSAITVIECPNEETTMTTLLTRPVGPWRMNTYLIVCKETGVSAVVDPGADAELILELAEGTRIQKILLTHGHSDHTGALVELKAATGASVYIHPADAKAFSVEYDHPLTDGEDIAVGNLHVRAIHTPGHTPGSICFDLGDGQALVGDALFVGGPGATRTPEDFALTMRTMQAVFFTWTDERRFYPGHGPSGQIGDERQAREAFMARGWSADLHGDVTWA